MSEPRMPIDTLSILDQLHESVLISNKDNIVVLSHDPAIGGAVVEETLAEDLSKIALKKGDFIPTLEETIKEVKKQNKTN